MDHILKIENVSKSYASYRALNEVRAGLSIERYKWAHFSFNECKKSSFLCNFVPQYKYLEIITYRNVN